MKFINLLSMGMIVCSGITAQAQTVFQQDFSQPKVEEPTAAAYYEFINLQPADAEEKVDNWTIADEALKMDNSADYVCEGQKWQRAIKFRNLPLEEKKLYKLSFKLSVDELAVNDETAAVIPGYVDFKLMQGDENADICIMGADGTTEQRKNVKLEETGEQTISGIFYFADLAKQNAVYEERCAGKENYAPQKFFAGINVYAPGKYTLDDIKLEESSALDKVVYSAYSIRMYYGNTINASELCGTGERYILDKSCAKVTVNGAEVDIDGVEVQSDGYLYIFTMEEIPTDAEVKVSLTAPEAIKFSAAWEGVSLSFANVTAEHVDDAELEAKVPFSWAPATVVKSFPMNDSFGLSETLDAMTIELDHNIDASSEIHATVNGKDVAASDISFSGNTVTIKGGSFPKGSYNLVVKGILNDGNQTPMDEDIKISFETGKPKVATTEYELLTSVTFPEAVAGNIPEGWTVMSDGQERLTSAENYQGGGRVFECSSAGITKGIYTRANNGEGSITSPKINLEAGNTQIRSYLAYWSNASSVLAEVYNAAGEVVASGTFALANKAENNLTTFEFEKCNIDLNVAEAGEYYVKYTLQTTGFNGMFLGGFDVNKVTVTEGESFTAETVASGEFTGWTANNTPKHGTGWKMFNASGVMHNADLSCAWGQAERDAVDNSRVLGVQNKGFGGMAMYFGSGNAYATYGQFDVQTEREGEVTDPETGATLPEKTLEIETGKYEVTYYIAGWKNDTEKLKFEIYNFDEYGSEGAQPVYSRTDEAGCNANGGNAVTQDAKKIQFFWQADGGKYVLKLTSVTGEIVWGNLTIKTTASLALQYTQKMNEALEPAKEELEAAQAKDEYTGTTRNKLDQIIKDYANNNFTTIAEYDKAFEDIDLTIKAMKQRRSDIDSYPAALQSVKEGLEAAQGTKFEALPQYPIVEKAYNENKDVDYISLDDAKLKDAVAVMQANGSLLYNMVNTCVPLLTKQMTELAAAIVALDDTYAENALVLSVDNAITDDQAIVKNLKKLYTALFYKKCANEETNPFIEIDPETSIDVPKEIEANYLIQNPNFYCTSVPAAKSVAATVDGFPGWTVELISGQITSAYGLDSWCGPYPTTECPVKDCAARSGWGATEFDISQVITDIPVVKYTLGITIGEDGGGSEHSAYAYCGETQAPYDGYESEGTTKYNRDEATPRTFEDVTPAYEGTLGAVTLGAHMKVDGGFINCDKATLTMTGLVEGFNYAAAAQALLEEIATDAASVKAETVGDPINVVYYDLNGAQTSTPSGVVIKIETYANGVIKATKVIK